MPGREFLANSLQLVAIKPQNNSEQTQEREAHINIVVEVGSEPRPNEERRPATKPNWVRMQRVRPNRRPGWDPVCSEDLQKNVRHQQRGKKVRPSRSLSFELPFHVADSTASAAQILKIGSQSIIGNLSGALCAYCCSATFTPTWKLSMPAWQRLRHSIPASTLGTSWDMGRVPTKW